MANDPILSLREADIPAPYRELFTEVARLKGATDLIGTDDLAAFYQEKHTPDRYWLDDGATGQLRDLLKGEKGGAGKVLGYRSLYAHLMRARYHEQIFFLKEGKEKCGDKSNSGSDYPRSAAEILARLPQGYVLTPTIETGIRELADAYPCLWARGKENVFQVVGYGPQTAGSGTMYGAVLILGYRVLDVFPDGTIAIGEVDKEFRISLAAYSPDGMRQGFVSIDASVVMARDNLYGIPTNLYRLMATRRDEAKHAFWKTIPQRTEVHMTAAQYDVFSKEYFRGWYSAHYFVTSLCAEQIKAQLK